MCLSVSGGVHICPLIPSEDFSLDEAFGAFDRYSMQTRLPFQNLYAFIHFQTRPLSSWANVKCGPPLTVNHLVLSRRPCHIQSTQSQERATCGRSERLPLVTRQGCET